MAKRLKAGDVVRLAVPGGSLYLHYLGTHPEYGDCVVACPRKLAGKPEIDEQLFRDGFVVFYPARRAVRQGLAHAVGHILSTGVPTRLRRPGARMGDRVTTWMLEDGTTEEMKRQLTEQERRIPLAVMFNHELLVQRILEGWRPESEGEAS